LSKRTLVGDLSFGLRKSPQRLARPCGGWADFSLYLFADRELPEPKTGSPKRPAAPPKPAVRDLSSAGVSSLCPVSEGVMQRHGIRGGLVGIAVVAGGNGGAFIAAGARGEGTQAPINVKGHQRFEEADRPDCGLPRLGCAQGAEPVVDAVGDLFGIADEGLIGRPTELWQIGVLIFTQTGAGFFTEK
jgi:hypothetical protein